MKKFKITISNLFIVLPVVVQWACQGFKLDRLMSIKDYMSLISRIHLATKPRGKEFAVDYIKLLRTCLLNYLSGNQGRVPGVSLTKDGIPKVFGAFIPIIRTGSPSDLKLLLTILYVTRALKLGRIPDIKSITDAPSAFCDISEYAVSFWKDLGYLPSQKHLPKAIRFSSYHFSTKSGPNGHAMFQALRDYFSLTPELKESLIQMGGKNIESKFSELENAPKELLARLFPIEPGKLRKLSYFPDKEKKVRVIGILDYFSQTVLRPLHLYLFRVLKKIPQDCTFDQGGSVNKLLNQEIYYSVDLSAATDRFPIETIASVLEGKLPSWYVSAWKHVMVATPFWYKPPKGEAEEVLYSTGNPMGAYSSWASFALAHHYVVYYCCKKLNIEWKTLPYTLLGDDIVICNKDVAELYLQTVKSLGVEVSDLKTHISPHFYEFAKRLSYKNQDITPFPISALNESVNRSYLFANLLMESENKGWIAVDTLCDNVTLFYGIVMKLPSRYKKKFHNKARFAELIMRIMRGALTAHDGLNIIAEESGISLNPPVSANEGVNILANCSVELFAESNPLNRTDSPTGISLGDMAIMAVCELTDPENGEVSFDLIPSIPVIYAHGAVSELFMDKVRLARDIDIKGDQWPLLMKTMALPLDDRIYVQRTSHLIAQASSRLGQMLSERFRTLQQYPQLRW